MPPQSRFGFDVRQQIVARYQAGEHTGALAKEYGCSSSTIHGFLKEAGVKAERRRSGAASWERRNGLPADEGDLISGFRWCSVCRKRKPMDDFYWAKVRNSAPTRRIRQCKPCNYSKAKAGANLRANRRKYLYGMTQADYDRLFELQGGACAVCREPAKDGEGRGLHVDHCHREDRIRGLLCDFCNRGIGMFRDNADFLASAAAYLLDPRSFQDSTIRITNELGDVYLAQPASHWST